jgi:hypothetical protein
MRKHSDSVDRAVLARIRQAPRGRVFSPSDLLDLGSRAAVDQALSRNVRAGRIRRVGRGLYDVPASDAAFGPAPADPDAVARALARRDGARLVPSGGHAANMLGLSAQVPVRPVYLTDAPSRRVRLGGQTVLLKHRQPRTLRTKHPVSALVIQALRWLGRDVVDDRTIATLRRNLPPRDRARLLDDIRHAPAWIADIFRALADEAA